MKKLFLSLAAFCAIMLTSCGNAEMDKINQLVIEATIKTEAATSPEEVGKIATDLQAAMEKIEAESGEKISFGKSVDEALDKYQKAAAAKLAEFGIE